LFRDLTGGVYEKLLPQHPVFISPFRNENTTIITMITLNKNKKKQVHSQCDAIKMLEDHQPRPLHGFVKSMTKTQKKLFQSLTLKSDDSDVSTKTETTVAMKSVRFEDQVKVRRTIARNAYTVRERRACWFTQEENNRILKSNLKLVQKMNEDCDAIERRYCVRGLERHTRIGNIVRQESRSDAKIAVLDEQERQRQTGIIDEKSIASIYNARTSSSQLWAQVIGMQDHREAQKYVSDSDLRYYDLCR
jgi:hypothetical protein